MTPRAFALDFAAWRVNGWWAYWFLTTASVTVVATATDAALLQRKWNYFTGGFLARDYTETWVQVLGFVVGSVLADAALLSISVTLALWVALMLRLSARWAVALAVVASLAPLIVAEFVTYRLLSFLGDSFDVTLMFDLSGRNIREFLAVSPAQLPDLAWVGAVALPMVAWVGWVAIRKVTDRIWAKTVGFVNPHGIRAVAASCILLAIASVATYVFRGSSDAIDNGLKRKPTVSTLSLAISLLSDVDRDGYGVLGRISDTAPFDSTVHPFALDVPGNGIDEDGVGGDLPADSEPYVESPMPEAAWARKPSIVFVMLESVRDDAVGSSSAGQPVTPVLDLLAQKGVRASAAYSHNGYTVQSRQHAFSGSLAGLRGNTTLIDDFKAQGYEVAYFSGQDESFGDAEGDVGFSRADTSYDARSDIARRYSKTVTPGSLAVPYEVVLERVDQFLSQRSNTKPLFLVVNFHDTHFPYHHTGIAPILPAPVIEQSEIQPNRAAELRMMYANTLANVDRAIGRLLQQVTSSLGSEPGVIVTSDHGESLFDEDSLGHGYILNDAQTRVPLIVSNFPMRLEEPLGQSDLRARIIEALSQSDRDSTAPTVVSNPSRAVFQYLGVLQGPVQIGLTSVEGRVSYDFRSRRARIGAGPWLRPEALSPEDNARFLRLVRTWERMMLARSKAR